MNHLRTRPITPATGSGRERALAEHTTALSPSVSYGAEAVKEDDGRWFVHWWMLDFSAHGARGGGLTEEAARALAERVRRGGPDVR